MKFLKTASAGFTLIELMVTLAIAAVLLTIAAPSMTAFKRNSELTSLSNTLLSAVNTARGEALKRNRAAYVTPSDGKNSWAVGWIVFVDKNNNQVFDDEATDLLVFRQAAPASYFSITGSGTVTENPAYIRFDASGYPKLKSNMSGNLTFTITRNDLSSSDLLENTRRLKISSVGRTRICKPVSATDSACSATGG